MKKMHEEHGCGSVSGMTAAKAGLLTLILLFSGYGSLAAKEGFFRDIFMDGGVFLTSRTTLPAADSLQLSLQFLATENKSWQSDVIVGSRYDENGFLFYPDGARRFRMIYTNGGKASSHGVSLGSPGRARIREFFRRGGSYAGSCAGAYLCSNGYMADTVLTEYYNLWPGWIYPTGISNTRVDHYIPEGSALRRIWNEYETGSYIHLVYHNGGGYMDTLSVPEGTEVLVYMDDMVNSWAYKPEPRSGRVVVTGSHPEGESLGGNLHMMMSLLRYALEGEGPPEIKGELENGIERVMDRRTSDEDPDFTMIGDLQYHHYRIELPETENRLLLRLKSAEGYDMHLFLDPDSFAFQGSSEYAWTEQGSEKTVELSALPAGHYYVGVKCATTVISVADAYVGDLSVLNGVPYSIRAEWNEGITGLENGLIHSRAGRNFRIMANYPNPFNGSTQISIVLTRQENLRMRICDLKGRTLYLSPVFRQQAGEGRLNWPLMDLSSGNYLCIIESADDRSIHRVTYIK